MGDFLPELLAILTGVVIIQVLVSWSFWSAKHPHGCRDCVEKTLPSCRCPGPLALSHPATSSAMFGFFPLVKYLYMEVKGCWVWCKQVSMSPIV